MARAEEGRGSGRSACAGCRASPVTRPAQRAIERRRSATRAHPGVDPDRRPAPALDFRGRVPPRDACALRVGRRRAFGPAVRWRCQPRSSDTACWPRAACRPARCAPRDVHGLCRRPFRPVRQQQRQPPRHRAIVLRRTVLRLHTAPSPSRNPAHHRLSHSPALSARFRRHRALDEPRLLKCWRHGSSPGRPPFLPPRLVSRLVGTGVPPPSSRSGSASPSSSFSRRRESRDEDAPARPARRVVCAARVRGRTVGGRWRGGRGVGAVSARHRKNCL